MSEAFIVRRGVFGGKGLDPNGAVLKVITSTGCSIAVSGTGYSQTHEQADGFQRDGDANVTEHFFSIPAYAFGTIAVVATNTYGQNTKTIPVDTAGKVYELLCGGVNIILDQNFGWQNANLNTDGWTYSERYKIITNIGDAADQDVFALPWPSITAYSRLTVVAKVQVSGSIVVMRLKDQDDIVLCSFTFGPEVAFVEKTGDIENKWYPTAQLTTPCQAISKIVFS